MLLISLIQLSESSRQTGAPSWGRVGADGGGCGAGVTGATGAWCGSHFISLSSDVFLHLHFNGVCERCMPLLSLLKQSPPINYAESYASQKVGGAPALQLAAAADRSPHHYWRAEEVEVGTKLPLIYFLIFIEIKISATEQREGGGWGVGGSF